VFRLIAIPALAFAGVLIYRGVQDRFTLPECDSSRAKQTLSDVLGQLKVEPLRDEPIKTISSSKELVVCNVVLPLSDGGTLNINYSFSGKAVPPTCAIRFRGSRRRKNRRPKSRRRRCGPTRGVTIGLDCFVALLLAVTNKLHRIDFAAKP
jgi:hypothetical protein